MARAAATAVNHFLKALAVLTEKYQPYALFTRFTAEENTDVRTYSACVGSLYTSTSVINHFATMKPPESLDERYLVVWGVLQAFIIQQDAVRELHHMFVEPTKKKGFGSAFKNWHELRGLRDATGGHPTSPAHASSLMVVARASDDWGVLVRFQGKITPIHPYICNRLTQYEGELLEALKVVTDGLQRRVEAVQ